jgi:hypothetical protein
MDYELCISEYGVRTRTHARNNTQEFSRLLFILSRWRSRLYTRISRTLAKPNPVYCPIYESTIMDKQNACLSQANPLICLSLSCRICLFQPWGFIYCKSFQTMRLHILYVFSNNKIDIQHIQVPVIFACSIVNKCSFGGKRVWGVREEQRVHRQLI